MKNLLNYLNRRCEIRIDSPILRTPGFNSYSLDLGIVTVFNQCEDEEDSNDLYIIIGLFVCSIHIQFRFGGKDRHETQNDFIQRHTEVFKELCEKAIETESKHDCHGKGYEVRGNTIYCRECINPLFDIIR